MPDTLRLSGSGYYQVDAMYSKPGNRDNDTDTDE